MKKYMLHPGWVTSKHDGDRHYINARRLADLYRVSLGQCLSACTPEGQANREPLIDLYPSYDGDYTLPEGPCA